MSKLELFRVEVDRGLIEGVIDTEDLSVKAITAYQRRFYPDTDKSLPLWMDEFSLNQSPLVFVLDPYNSLEEVNQSCDVGYDFRRAAIDKMMDQSDASIKLSDQQASEILTAVSFHPKTIFEELAESFRESVVTAP